MLVLALTALLATSLAPARAAAQGGALSRDRGIRCDGLVVSEIVYDLRKPTVSGIYGVIPALGRTRRDIHITTRRSIVRRFLALRVGDVCSEVRRLESARILRAQPFIADASVIAEPDGNGGVRLLVSTIDELSVVVGGSVSSSPAGVNSLRLGTLNLRGTGISLIGDWQRGGFYRDLFSLRAIDHQFLGRPYQLVLFGARRQHGTEWQTGFAHPFFTDLQRAAWVVSLGASDDYVAFLRDRPAPSSALASSHRFLDVGGIVRIGAPGQLSVFGMSLSREIERTGQLPVVITDSGIFADTSAALIGRYGSHRTARINALWGVRNLGYRPVYGFDALAATQDVRTGFQLGTLFGRGISLAGSQDDDIFVSSDLYVGWATPMTLMAVQVQGEGRDNYDDNRWDGVLASGRAAWYHKTALSQTTILSAEYGGGWRQRTPFQLTLRDDMGGVPGYASSRAVGGQRVVVRAEQRWTWTRWRRAGIGMALFADAGKLWAGDVPFGRTTRVNPSFGTALLAAIPPRSKRLWRLEVAFPTGPDRHGRWQVGLTSGDRTASFWDEPSDVRRGRERSVPASIFRWP